ncbi:hypothetical protein KUF71_017269 [Frankliniella fusca]|uniref:Uncharacterized protein n=1 Tax=Frankliniella fusca TaxID=407009 RepID=A0AAE1LRF4_9NEOP|nr:hypothetical protein KUF71_017269 [Frankliniella fusca]
MCLSFHLQ